MYIYIYILYVLVYRCICIYVTCIYYIIYIDVYVKHPKVFLRDGSHPILFWEMAMTGADVSPGFMTFQGVLEGRGGQERVVSPSQMGDEPMNPGCLPHGFTVKTGEISSSWR